MGLWAESIASNRAVAAAARRHKVVGEELHAMDYLVFAHLQRGEDRQAREVVESMPPLEIVPEDAVLHFASLHATASIRARDVVERGKWAEAAALSNPVGFPGGRYAWADAVIYFARALGAARSGDVERARRDVETLARLRGTLEQHGEQYWAGQVEIQRRAAAAWLALAENRPEAALEVMRSAATLSDASDKHPVTPGHLVPPRVLLGQMLLELDRPVEALSEFRGALQAKPNRFGALSGAALAAERAGQPQKARERYAELVRVAPASDRKEVVRARTYLAAAPD